VWCDLPEEVPATIDAMVAAGDILPEDRGRCVFWAWAAFLLCGHQEGLSLLD